MRINVLEAGAKGDGVTDDTAAIQNAINQVAAFGGGVVYFPYTRGGYRIGQPAVEEVRGRPAKSQLYIDRQVGAGDLINICLEGEMPVMQLNGYIVRDNLLLNDMKRCNTRIISSWEAPEQHDPALRPYSLLSAVEGDWCRGKFGTGQVTLKNLEFQAFLNPDKMYATGSCVNLQHTSRCIIQDCYFGLDKNVGDGPRGLQLLESPSHTAGLIMPGDQSDNQMLRNAGTQGFKYGMVLGEMLVADYLTIANCETAIVANSFTELSQVQHVVSHNNRVILSPFLKTTFGMVPNKRVFLRVGVVNFEHCRGEKGHPDGWPPVVNNTVYGVFDPEDRLYGCLQWYCGWPPNDNYFPVEGAKNMRISRFWP